MYAQLNQCYYYYDDPSQDRKFLFAKCINETTLGAFRIILPITHQNFVQNIIYSLVFIFTVSAVAFFIILFNKIPFTFSFCTLFFLVLGALYFYFVYSLYKKAYELYQENPQYAMEYAKWHQEIINKNRNSSKSIREILFEALEADSVLELYFKDLTYKTYRQAYMERIFVSLAILLLSLLTFSIEYFI